MDQLGEGFLHAMHDPAPYGADAESAQVRSTSGEPRSRYPELHDGWKAPEGSLRFGLSAGLTCSRPAYSTDFLSEQGGLGRGSLAVRGRCFCW